MKPFIVFEHNGAEVKVEAFNFKGPACEVATKVFTDALGVTQRKVKRKPEFYAGNVQLKQTIGSK